MAHRAFPHLDARRKAQAWFNNLGISRKNQDLASPMLSRRQAMIISLSIEYSGLTTRNRPSLIS